MTAFCVEMQKTQGFSEAKIKTGKNAVTAVGVAAAP
jgi:hypothetical protein